MTLAVGLANAPAQILIIGGGGHARMLIDALRSAQEVRRIAVLDADRTLHGTSVYDAPVVGGDECVAELIQRGATCFAIGVGSPVSGSNELRQLLFEQTLAYGLQALTIIHPRASVSPNAVVQDGVQMLSGAIVNSGAHIGMNAIINSGAIIEHDCNIGAHAQVASGACLAGAVTVGFGAYIGAGSVVRQGISVGEQAVVGLGAVVVRDVPPRCVVAGVPAKILRSA